MAHARLGVTSARPAVGRQAADRVVRSIVLVCGGILTFTLLGATVKWLGATYDTAQIVFGRCIFGLLPLLPFLYAQGPVRAVRTVQPMLHAWRAFFGLIAMGFNYYSLSVLPIADAIAVLFTVPLLTTAGAALFLRERVGRVAWAAVAAGLAGVLLIVSPEGGVTPEGVAIALVGCVSTACANLILRRIGSIDRSETVVLWFIGAPVLVLAFVAPFGWVRPDWEDVALLAGMSALGGVGQLMVTRAYQHTEVRVLAPFDYTQIVWAVLLGWFLWGTMPAASAVAGMLIIAAAGLAVAYRETRPAGSSKP